VLGVDEGAFGRVALGSLESRSEYVGAGPWPGADVDVTGTENGVAALAGVPFVPVALGLVSGGLTARGPAPAPELG
jgi:hypothetical protein